MAFLAQVNLVRTPSIARVRVGATEPHRAAAVVALVSSLAYRALDWSEGVVQSSSPIRPSVDVDPAPHLREVVCVCRVEWDLALADRDWVFISLGIFLGVVISPIFDWIAAIRRSLRTRLFWTPARIARPASLRTEAP